MTAFLGISLWITLGSVIPGIITISVIYGAIVCTGTENNQSILEILQVTNDWIKTGIALIAMLLTQSIGILLEGFLIKNRLLGPEQRKVVIPKGIDPCGETNFHIQPYSEYRGMYLLLAELRENEDSQGHLQRCLGQFFLTNNVIVSFSLALIITIWRMIHIEVDYWPVSLKYICFLIISLIILYIVSYIRFDVMTKALWAARRRRLETYYKKDKLYLKAQLDDSDS